jgi:hypothetical protein
MFYGIYNAGVTCWDIFDRVATSAEREILVNKKDRKKHPTTKGFDTLK